MIMVSTQEMRLKLGQEGVGLEAVSAPSLISSFPPPLPSFLKHPPIKVQGSLPPLKNASIFEDLCVCMNIHPALPLQSSNFQLILLKQKVPN